MWWLLPIGILIGIVGTLVGCNFIAKWFQKKMENESQIYENVNLILWIEWGNKMEITWDLSQWEEKEIMVCHVVYCDREMRAMGFANGEMLKEILEAQGPSVIMTEGVTVYQWGGNFIWEF